MKRFLGLIGLVIVIGLACATPARAHFIWLLPSEEGAKLPGVRMIFSEDTRPDQPELLKKIAQTELFMRGAESSTEKVGKTTALKPTLDKDALSAEVPGDGQHQVGAVCRYGVVQHGDAEPFLLHYYAKTFIAPKLLDFGLAPHSSVLIGKSWDKLPLEIVPDGILMDPPTMRVLWQGKPLADAEVVILLPGVSKKVVTKTDTKGLFQLTVPNKVKNGILGIRALYKEAKEGEVNGKKYKQVRHYTTLTLQIPGTEDNEAAKPQAKRSADSAATKLLAEARAARALYHDFPGFTADIEVNLDGNAQHGQVEVGDAGKVTLKLDDDADAAKWAKNTLGSIIGHRLSGGPDEETPCAFADEDQDHPLGRAIRVLNDEFHSSYRIRDRQVIVVNRKVPGARFTITVMENVLTKEKKFLPTFYVVNTWNAETNALTSSETHHQTWQRVGAFDLPAETLAVKATAGGKLESRSLKLSKIALK